MTRFLVIVLAADMVVSTGFACGVTVGRDSNSWRDYARCCGAALAAVVVTFVLWRFVLPVLAGWAVALSAVHPGHFGLYAIALGSHWLGSFALVSMLRPRPRRWLLLASVTALCRLVTLFLMTAAFGALR